MRFSQSIFLMTAVLGLTGVAVAEAPRKQGLSRYSMLWTNSPFTVKPTEESAQAVNPLNDWALGGVSEVNGGYYLILMNRKKPTETEIVEPGVESAFKVLAVRRDPVDYLKTQVQVSYHGESGWVTYDEKLLTLAKGPAANPQQQHNQGQPGMNNPNMPPGGANPTVPGIPGMNQGTTGNPPNPTANAGGAPGGRGGPNGGGAQSQQRGPRQRIIAPANR